MNYNIIEVIDSLLPKNLIDIVYLDLPDKGDCLLIEESRASSVIESLEGFEGVITSNIQFYIRKDTVGDYYNDMLKVLKSFYKLVYQQIGNTIGNITIENVGSYEISSSMRDKNDNCIISMDFGIKYKENN